MNLQNECKFGKENEKMSGRGWIKETTCNNEKIKFRYDDRRCPYQVQQKCKFYEPVDVVQEDIVTIKNLQDLDELADAIRDRMKAGPVKVQLR